MGARPSKGPETGPGPLQGVWRRAQGTVILRSSLGERPENPGMPAPYRRRVGMIQDVLLKAKEGRHEEASELLKSLRQEGESLSAMEKVCRQLMYHLSPHPRWRRQGLLKGKPPASLKAVLSVSPDGTVDLSGLPLSSRDAERLVLHLQCNSARVRSVELGFTELTDDTLLMLLPTLSTLPALESLALNGNRLTRGVLRHLTDVLKEPRSFPALVWVDLGNNVDIFSLPQAFLVSLRKRCPKQGNLPTIQEQPEQGGGACEGAGSAEVEEDPD
ncbi:Leucine-rich repeat-containing protein 75A [Bagarius yarrelli]|uniref:Leucine-rich repeat-containing protein 75A n=1 Tax=Bagarius yarrelli TaxID=175774 RepID=A0A556TY74_BAGYA|nr:Leucine-rich repeat-containing protein 75A [Bagarius yarrelli]